MNPEILKHLLGYWDYCSLIYIKIFGREICQILPASIITVMRLKETKHSQSILYISDVSKYNTVEKPTHGDGVCLGQSEATVEFTQEPDHLIFPCTSPRGRTQVWPWWSAVYPKGILDPHTVLSAVLCCTCRMAPKNQLPTCGQWLRGCSSMGKWLVYLSINSQMP